MTILFIMTRVINTAINWIKPQKIITFTKVIELLYEKHCAVLY